MVLTMPIRGYHIYIYICLHVGRSKFQMWEGGVWGQFKLA